jgi:hypothetical protein
MNDSLDTLDALLDNPAIWRAGEPAANAGPECIGSDYPALDAALPGGGWPRGALTEVLYDHSGIGELRLLMPALARLSHQGGWIALVAPPHIPYAPALRQYGIDLSRVLLIHPNSRTDSLWALEQALRTGTCGAVLAWPRQIDDRSLRRLQLAAEAGDTLGVLFRETSAAEQPSPAALRLRVSRDEQGRNAQARILKCRGGTRCDHLPLDLDNPPAPTTGEAMKRPTTPPGPRDRRPTQRPRQTRRSSGTQPRAAQMDLPLPGGNSPSGAATPTSPERANNRGNGAIGKHH